MTHQIMDQISAVDPPTATAVTLLCEQTAEQKQDSGDTECLSNLTPNLESLDVSQDSNGAIKFRSKRRIYSTVLMLFVR
jgi:hypothetical protein